MSLGINKNKNMKNSNSNKIVTVVTYEDAGAQMKSILKENKGKSGVYRWVNKKTGNTYVGSSTNLGKRFSSYFRHKYITDPKRNMLIHKAFIKYGYSNFKLEILEYVNKSLAVVREQCYISLLKPEYNILNTAGSSLGHKHTESTKEKIRNKAIGRIFSDEHRAKISLNNINRSEELKAKVRARLATYSQAKAHKVEITNTLTNTIAVYDSIRKAAIELNTNHTTIRRYIKNQKLFKGIYEIKLDS
jgi:group I intron endonuclease